MKVVVREIDETHVLKPRLALVFWPSEEKNDSPKLSLFSTNSLGILEFSPHYITGIVFFKKMLFLLFPEL